MSKSVAPRGIDYQSADDCASQTRRSYERDLNGFDILCCVLLGSFATLSAFLAMTTFHYRKKAQALKDSQYLGDPASRREGTEKMRQSRCRESRKQKEPGGERQAQQNGQRGKGREKEKRSRQGSSSRQLETMLPEPGYLDLDMMMLDNGGGLYHEQYNEHGVLIERPDIM
jgi:hypothetical protein